MVLITPHLGRFTGKHLSTGDVTAPVAYSIIGFQHIIPDGIDHLLFVLGLCLGARSIRSLVLLITFFTLAHTLSLGAMTMGLVAGFWIARDVLLG